MHILILRCVMNLTATDLMICDGKPVMLKLTTLKTANHKSKDKVVPVL
jgi:hypothetical protein